MNSLETSANSPFKPKVFTAKQSFIKTGPPYTSPSKMSETEAAIYAHGLIREVMQQSIHVVIQVKIKVFGINFNLSIPIASSMPNPNTII